MFKVIGEYIGSINNGITVVGEVFFPKRKRTIKVDKEQLGRLVAAANNGWFKIHSCEPKNPFILDSEVKAQEAKLKAEEEARLKAEEEAKLKAEEEAKLKAEEEAKLKAEEAKKKTTSKTKKKAEEPKAE